MTDLMILSGLYKGTRIRSPKTGKIRPTSSRVRKSLFDILGDLKGSSVLDLFSGTGALGFEAASRGASTVTFVEKNRKLSDSIRKNSLLFNEVSIQVRNKDVFTFIDNCEDEFDLLFVDPPYGILDLNMLLGLVRNKLTKDGRLIIESSARERWRHEDGKVRIYGDTQLTFFQSL